MNILFFIRKRSWIKPLLVLLFLFSAVGAFASSDEQHGAKGWVSTDTYRVMNFAVLAVGLFFILRKPVSQALRDRIKGIETQLGELEEKKRSAEKSLAEYSARLSLLDQEAEKIINGYIKQGEEAKARILEEAKISAQKFEEQARRNIEQEFKKARLALQEDIFEKAITKAEEIIKTRITGEDQDRLIDEYLDKVVAS